MHSVGTEVRVGIFALITLSILAFSLFWLNGGRMFEQGSILEIEFERVDGIREGAPVKLAGVDIGRVKRIYFSKNQTVVVVAVKLQPRVHINEGSRFIITSAGVIGEKHMEILPGKSTTPVKEGSRFQGETPISTEDFFRSAYEVLKDTQTILSSIRDFTDDAELKESIASSAENLRVLTGNLRQFSNRLNEVPLETMVARANRTLETLERIAVTSEPQIHQIVSDLAKASDQITAVLVKADRFMDEVNGDGQASQDIRQILSLSARTLEDIEQLTSTLNQEKEHVGPLLEEAGAAARSIREAADSLKNTFDSLNESQDGNSPANKEETKSAFQKLQETISKTHRLVSNLDRMKHKLGLSGKEDNWGLDYRLDFGSGKDSAFILDWKNIGAENSLSFQYGRKFGNIRPRLGYINDEFGGGVDWAFNQRWSLSIDVWNPHDLQADVMTDYLLNKHWTVGTGAFNVFEDPTFLWQIGYWF